MYSRASVLQKSAAVCALVESHDTSTIRFVPDVRTRTPPAAVSSASFQSWSALGGLSPSALRHTPRRSEGRRPSGGGIEPSFPLTRWSRLRLCRSFTWVWMSASTSVAPLSTVGDTFFMFRNSWFNP